MHKVSKKLFRCSVVILLTVFAFSTMVVNPQVAEAITVKVSTYPSSADIPSSLIKTIIRTSSPEGSSSAAFACKPLITQYPSSSSNSTATAPEDEEQCSVEKEIVAEGSKYATDLYIIRSGKPGPVVMIVGGVHGNEPAGYKAASKVKDFEINNGTLLVLPEANKRAVDNNERYVSGEGDLNRDFPQSASESADNTLSKAIYKIVQDYDVDWLMDMHEGYDYYKNTSTSSVGQSLIYYPSTTTKDVASSIVDSLNSKISTSYKEFSLLKYPVPGSLARSTAQFLGVHSFIMETCTKQELSTRINYQLKAADKLLSELGMM